MQQDQTVRLLRDCNAGIKTAVNSLEAVSQRVKGDQLADMLDHYLDQHERLGDEAHAMLYDCGGQPKEPSAMARMMAGSKISMMYAMHPTDETLADLVSDGCSMGVRKLTHRRNTCPEASADARGLAQRVVEVECEMVDRLGPYL